MHIAAADPDVRQARGDPRRTCSRRRRRSTARSSPARASRPTSSTRSSRASSRATTRRSACWTSRRCAIPTSRIKQMVADAAAKTGENVTDLALRPLQAGRNGRIGQVTDGLGVPSGLHGSHGRDALRTEVVRDRRTRPWTVNPTRRTIPSAMSPSATVRLLHAHPPEAVRRSADGRPDLRRSIPAVATRIAQDIAEIQALGVQTADRDRRRQHLPRPGRQRARHGPLDRRLHGHAGHRDQRAGAAGRAREARRRRPAC